MENQENIKENKEKKMTDEMFSGFAVAVVFFLGLLELTQNFSASFLFMLAIYLFTSFLFMKLEKIINKK